MKAALGRTLLAAVAVQVMTVGTLHAQITEPAGDGVLNAPYRGTIDSLREQCTDIPFGEVKSHVEPLVGSPSSPFYITSPELRVWADEVWDRSVLRLYNGLDASGTEIDLTGTSYSTPAIVPTDPDGFNRFSFRAMGTKTLAVQTFSVHFRYALEYNWTEVVRTIKVAPVTGSLLSLPGESEAFHYGTPVLQCGAGAVSLTVPIGVTADMIGTPFNYRDRYLGPSSIDSSDVVLPGAAESMFIQNMNQFKLEATGTGPKKSAYGAPWPGHLVGYYNSADVYGPDGTHFDTPSLTVDGMWRFNFVRPYGLSETHPASQRFTYDGSNRVTEIRDGATPANVITLTRDGSGRVTRATTSNGRGWTIQNDPADGHITGIIPDGGIGARYFTWSAPLNAGGRVSQVKDAGQTVLYEFVYDADGDLREEWRRIDGQLRLVVEHLVVDEGHRRRREHFGPGPGDYRQYDFYYDLANDMNHRLAGMTAYSDPGATGTSFTTTYTHDVGLPSDPPNEAGTMALTRVDLPDGTYLLHEHDAQYNPQCSPPTNTAPINVGFRTRTTHVGPHDGSLVTFDVDYEFFYPYSSAKRLFYKPRVIKQRDGRGTISEVVSDWENALADQNGDALTGEKSNHLLQRLGPAITLGTSGPRTPETRFLYHNGDPDPEVLRVLRRTETVYASGLYRSVAYGYDKLLRPVSETVDPGGENLLTRSLYCDAQLHRARTTVDADGYWTRTEHDNDGRVVAVRRYLTAGVGDPDQPCPLPSGAYCETQYLYDTNGRLDEQRVDNKDQNGTALTPAIIVTEYTPDDLGRVTLTVVDPGASGHVNQESHVVYNWLGETEREYDTSGRGRKFTYEGRGLVAGETPLGTGQAEQSSLATAFAHDAMGRRLFTYPPTHPLAGGPGPYEERTYDDFGRLETVVRHPGTDGGNDITTTYEYDAASHVTRTRVEEAGVGYMSDATARFDEGGFNYESRQRVVGGVDTDSGEVRDPLAQRKFDWAGNVTEERSLGDGTVADSVRTTIYDGAHRVWKAQDGLGGETVYTRDGRGNVTQAQVKLNGTESALTNATFDALNRAITTIDPPDGQALRHYRQRWFDSRGGLLRETAFEEAGATDVAVLTTVFGYDAAGRATRSVVLADPASTILAEAANVAMDRVLDSAYDADGRLRYRTTYNHNSVTPLTTETTYDAVGRVDRVTDPVGNYADEDYLANGRLAQRTVADGLGNRLFQADAYDGHDRVVSWRAVGPPDLFNVFEYDGLDRTVWTADPKGIDTVTDYDLVGRAARLVEDDGGALERETVLAYNRLSQLTSRTARNKSSAGEPLADQVTTFRYDSQGRATRAVYPDAAAGEHSNPDACTDCLRMTYDLAGRVTQRQDQRNTTVYGYELRGLVRTQTTGTTVDTFDHDALGRTVLAERGTAANEDAVAKTEMLYTAQGDLDYEDQTIAEGTVRRVDYGYDQAGNRSALAYPGGTVLGYTPTVLNQVDAVTLGGQALVDYGYQGRVLETRTITTPAPGGSTSYGVEFGYDHHRRVNGITNRLSTGGSRSKNGTGSFFDEDERQGGVVVRAESGQENEPVPVFEDHGQDARATQVLAAYSFTHDLNGNPLTQAATGLAEPGADFAADDRNFTVDRLNRLTGTDYAETGSADSSVFDLLGNREVHTNRAGEATDYTLANPANEYATVTTNGTPHPVSYDATGNLTRDEQGHGYAYDEHNRLTQVFVDSNGNAVSDPNPPDSETVLANIGYDALGRRVVFEDPVAGVTKRYYYAGSNVIEERSSADALTRYHVHGAQFADEHVATYEVGAAERGTEDPSPLGREGRVRGNPSSYSTLPQPLPARAGGHGRDPEPAAGANRAAGASRAAGWTYYLLNANYSVAGTGNADGSVIARLDYTPDGDFVGGGGAPTAIAHDADGDRDVDLADFAHFARCYASTDSACLSVQDFDVAGVSDGAIDLDDYAGFECCLCGPGVVPPATDIGHDSEPDGDVDLADWAEFQTCFGSTAPGCLATFDFDAAGHSDGIVNLGDLGGFTGRLSGPNVPASGGCPRRGRGEGFAPGLRANTPDLRDPAGRGGPGPLPHGRGTDRVAAADPDPNAGNPRTAPVSGTFALHGRPIDVLSDGLVLMDFRARVYLPTLGRWLQRDPSGYTDGGNLYESFRGNPGRFTDAFGLEGDETPQGGARKVADRQDAEYIRTLITRAEQIRSEFRRIDEKYQGKWRGDFKADMEKRPLQMELDQIAQNLEAAIEVAEWGFGLDLNDPENVHLLEQAQHRGIFAQRFLWGEHRVKEVGRQARSALEQTALAMTGGALIRVVAMGGEVATETSTLTELTEWASGSRLSSPLTGRQMLFPFMEEEAGSGLLQSGVPSLPKHYSVAFETTIPRVGAGTRPAHFKGANEALLAQMRADAELARAVRGVGIDVPTTTWGAARGRSPVGWTWHHVSDRPGVMQLVPRYEHASGSPWQPLLHSGEEGGFSLWGADY